MKHPPVTLPALSASLPRAPAEPVAVRRNGLFYQENKTQSKNEKSLVWGANTFLPTESRLQARGAKQRHHLPARVTRAVTGSILLPGQEQRRGPPSDCPSSAQDIYSPKAEMTTLSQPRSRLSFLLLTSLSPVLSHVWLLEFCSCLLLLLVGAPFVSSYYQAIHLIFRHTVSSSGGSNSQLSVQSVQARQIVLQ